MSALRGAAVALAVPGALLLGCRRGAEPPEGEPAATRAIASAAAPAPKPVDHLAPDELLEGPTRAFGLPLPRALEVEGSFPEVTYASGHATVHALALYFAAHLVGGGMREGTQAATFEHVRARAADGSSPAGPELLVRIGTAMGRANVEIRDMTPPPTLPAPDEPSRWRHVGLTADGHLADPHHLE